MAVIMRAAALAGLLLAGVEQLRSESAVTMRFVHPELTQLAGAAPRVSEDHRHDGIALAHEEGEPLAMGASTPTLAPFTSAPPKPRSTTHGVSQTLSTSATAPRWSTPRPHRRERHPDRTRRLRFRETSASRSTPPRTAPRAA